MDTGTPGVNKDRQKTMWISGAPLVTTKSKNDLYPETKNKQNQVKNT